MDEQIKFDNDSIINRLKNKLEGHNINSEKLFQILIKNKAFLSGSYLLQSICGNNYDAYDLDIFVLSDDRNGYLETQILELFKNSSVFSGKFNNICKEKANSYSSRKINSISTMELYNYELIYELRKIQIIYIDDKLYYDTKSYVDDYDTDICSNYYDGEKLYIKNLKNILNRYAEFNINLNNNNFVIPTQTLERIEKYAYRDFSIKINFGNNIVYELITDYGVIQNKKILLPFYTLPELYESIDKLPYDIENILIYCTYKFNNYIIDLEKINFPPVLKEIRFFNIDSYEGIPKLPFGCELYINNKKILF